MCVCVCVCVCMCVCVRKYNENFGIDHIIKSFWLIDMNTPRKKVLFKKGPQSTNVVKVVTKCVEMKLSKLLSFSLKGLSY